MKKIVSLFCVMALAFSTSLSVLAQDFSLSESEMASIEKAEVDFAAGVFDPGGSKIYHLAMDALKTYDERHPDEKVKEDPSTMEWILLGLLVASSVSAIHDRSQRQEACIKICTEETSNTYEECLSICRANPDAF